MEISQVDLLVAIGMDGYGFVRVFNGEPISVLIAIALNVETVFVDAQSLLFWLNLFNLHPCHDP